MNERWWSRQCTKRNATFEGDRRAHSISYLMNHNMTGLFSSGRLMDFYAEFSLQERHDWKLSNKRAEH